MFNRYSCRGQVGYTHTHPHPHPRIRKSSNPITRIFNWVYNIPPYPPQFGLGIKFFIMFRGNCHPYFQIWKEVRKSKEILIMIDFERYNKQTFKFIFSIYRTVYMPSSVNRAFKVLKNKTSKKGKGPKF